jgi:hypothetical protein
MTETHQYGRDSHKVITLPARVKRLVSAPTHTQTTLNEWSQVQDRRHQNRQGYQSAGYFDVYPREHAIINNVEATETYSNDAKFYGSVPAPIDPSVTWRIIGGNVNGLRPYGDMAILITVAERLRALQAEIIAFLETNIEWHKYQLRDNMQKLFTKAFGAARMEYSTASDKFETMYHKPGGTICGALGQMVHRVFDSDRDDTGCVRRSYITSAAKEGKQVSIVSAYRVCKQTNPGDMRSPKQQLGIMYKDEELRPYLVDPYKQTLIDLQYFVEKLKKIVHEVLILMDVNQSEEQTYQQQAHNIKLVMKKGFHVDGTIDRSLQSLMRKC